MKKLILVFVLALTFAIPAQAMEWTPFKLSLWDKVAAPPAKNVKGISLTLLRESSENVIGLDGGVLWPRVKGQMTGIQIAWITTQSNTLAGFQGSFVNRVSKEGKGIQMAYILNKNVGKFTGASLGVANVGTSHSGFQFGFYNSASDAFSGLQLGLVNVARIEKGVQIGLANINLNGPLYFFPIVNGRF
ncbi:hypothetical protein Dip518_000178 [Parelusimicrobium proximum]|uniref:LA_2272 family surface repeat-containing protein n=1 Tax=Parelusimicrobium proximum TaxID=3228953 RepID=UPI003D16C11B